jgi:hypothetical protein
MRSILIDTLTYRWKHFKGEYYFGRTLSNEYPKFTHSGFLSCLAVEKDKKILRGAKQAIIDFFIHYGFGKAYYSEQEIRKMFTELQRVNDLWPDEPATSKFIDHHAYWRGKYWKHWFQKMALENKAKKNDIAN